ncbi:MAG: fumarate reductase cytochrome b subunit [Campylobacteraceae bacterium]|nr:fumarate reductase cytochrome b subunit [Campylobacteraceae bacterium]
MVGKIEGFLGKSVEGKKSRIPALQDKLQSITGLILAAFMVCHMLFTGTIIFGKGAFEGVVSFAEPFGIWQITNIVAAIILVIFMIHGFLAMRKFPQNYKAFRAFQAHKIRFNHADTTLWWYQFITGFLLFFFASAHIITIVFGSQITAELSIARFHQLHLFYIALLVFTVSHAAIGTYRLYVKWVSIEGAKKEEMIEKRAKFRKINFIVWGSLFALSVIADIVWLMK